MTTRDNRLHIIEKGYRPATSTLNTSNPPKGGSSAVPSTPPTPKGQTTPSAPTAQGSPKK